MREGVVAMDTFIIIKKYSCFTIRKMALKVKIITTGNTVPSNCVRNLNIFYFFVTC